MKKLLWITCFLSVGLNIYLVKFDHLEIETPKIQQEVALLQSSSPKLKTLSDKDDCIVNQNKKTLSKVAIPKEKVREHPNDSLDYESLKKESAESIDRFVIDELNLNLETSALIIKTFEDGQKKFDLYLEEKQKTSNPSDEPKAYFFDAYDYIKIGRNRLETRRKLKMLLGSDSFTGLEKFIKSSQLKGQMIYEIL